MGLLLFLIYVHDRDTNISNDIGIKLTLFADDSSILITGKHTQDLIFNLDRISGNVLPWSDKNRLIINKGKSLALCFHPKSSKHIIFPDIIFIIIGIQPLGRSGQRPEFSQATGMALVRCILGKFLGVACHYFPPLF